MTNPVTQADRDAAERLAIGQPYTCFDCKDELTFSFAAHRLATEAAIVAWLRSEAQSCDCFAREEGDCACGAWSEYKITSVADLADAIERRGRPVGSRHSSGDVADSREFAGGRGMKLAEVVTLYDTNCRAIPDMLRQTADNIETEVEEGSTPTVAMFAIQLFENGMIGIYGWGDCDNMRSLAMIERGKDRLLACFDDDE